MCRLRTGHGGIFDFSVSSEDFDLPPIEHQTRPKSGSKICVVNSFHIRGGWKYCAACPLQYALPIYDFDLRAPRAPCAYTSALSTSLCINWICVSSNSNSPLKRYAL